MVPPGQRSVSHRRPAGTASVLHRRPARPDLDGTARPASMASMARRCGRQIAGPDNHGGILSSSHAPHGADDARGVNGINGNRARDGRPGIALAIMLGAQLMIILDMTVVNIALPHIQTSLHFSATSLSWVLSGYTLTSGGLLLLGGRAGDILGRRRMFIAGISLFTLASLAGGFATTPGVLLAARPLQGVGGAFASPPVLAL